MISRYTTRIVRTIAVHIHTIKYLSNCLLIVWDRNMSTKKSAATREYAISEGSRTCL